MSFVWMPLVTVCTLRLVPPWWLKVELCPDLRLEYWLGEAYISSSFLPSLQAGYLCLGLGMGTSAG